MKRNCWTCMHNNNRNLCEIYDDVVRAWWVSTDFNTSTMMPPRDADGCPGWADRGVSEMETTGGNGFTTAPDRYTRQERETVDRMRDLFRQKAGMMPAVGDAWFAVFCEANALKYKDRNGAKGDPEGDIEKACWWRMMAAHVRGEGPDPRHQREGFVPYEAGS